MNNPTRIVCCCGSGLGSSLILSLNVDHYISQHQLKNLVVSHSSISEVNQKSGDIFIVGLDVFPLFKNFKKVIIIKEIINYQELETKLSLALSSQKEHFIIQ